MNRRLACLALLAVVGCGDPANDRLATGDRVVLYDPKYDKVTGEVPPGQGFARSDTVFVVAGTSGTVVDDKATGDDRRKVRVNIQSGGDYRGVASFPRRNLRPAR